MSTKRMRRATPALDAHVFGELAAPQNYRIGVSTPGTYHELLNTDAVELGGSGHGNLGGVTAHPVRAHDRDLSLNVTLPPLGAVFLRRER